MRIVMNNDGIDGVRIAETILQSRAEFEIFTDRLFLVAESLWPTTSEPAQAVEAAVVKMMAEPETLPPLPLRYSPDPAPPAGRRKNEGIAARNARIIHMCRVEKRPRKDVAAAFGVSEKVIDNVLYRAVRA